MSTLNEVLRTDPNHYLALIRRSQVYKKVFLDLGRRESSIEPSKILKWLLHFVLTTFKWPPWKSRSKQSKLRTRIATLRRSQKVNKIHLMKSSNSILVIWRRLIAKVVRSSSLLSISARAGSRSVETLPSSTRGRIIVKRVIIPLRSVKRQAKNCIFRHSSNSKEKMIRLLFQHQRSSPNLIHAQRVS